MTTAQKAVPSVEDDRKRLARLAEMADALKEDNWQLVAKDKQMLVTVKRRNGVEAVLFEISPDAMSEEIEIASSAFEILQLLFRTRSRAADAFRQMREQQGAKPALKAKDYTTEAAMKLKERAFQRFLEEVGGKGPVRDEFAADKVLKALLRVDSKKKLNEDMVAQQAWFDLRGRFDAWVRGEP